MSDETQSLNKKDWVRSIIRELMEPMSEDLSSDIEEINVSLGDKSKDIDELRAYVDMKLRQMDARMLKELAKNREYTGKAIQALADFFEEHINDRNNPHDTNGTDVTTYSTRAPQYYEGSNGDTWELLYSSYSIPPGTYTKPYKPKIEFDIDSLPPVIVPDLSPISAVIGDTEEMKLVRCNAAAPTNDFIHSSWARFSDGVYYENSADLPEDAPASIWYCDGSIKYDAEGKPLYPDNSLYAYTTDDMNALLSKVEYNDFTHELLVETVGSMDNGNNGVVLASKVVEDVPHMLVLYRNRYKDNVVYPNNCGIVEIRGNEITLVATAEAESSVVPTNWGDSEISFTVNRVGNVITATSFDDQLDDADRTITLNLDEHENLAWVKEACSYGYFNEYAEKSIFKPGAFKCDQNIKVVYDYVDNKVWKYEEGLWSVKEGLTVQSELGFPRAVTSATSGKVYRLYIFAV
jgi:hypothetical protein